MEFVASGVALMNEILPDYIIATNLENNRKRHTKNRKHYLIFIINIFLKAVEKKYNKHFIDIT